MALTKLNILLVAVALFSSSVAQILTDGTLGEPTKETTPRTEGTQQTDGTSETTSRTTETTTTSTTTDTTTTSSTTTSTTTTPVPPPSDPPGECECNPCVNERFIIDLKEENQTLANATTGSIPGLHIVSFTPDRDECTARVVLYVEFLPYPTCDSRRYCYRCINGTTCSERMLQIGFQVGNNPTGWVFTIGDSISNDGNGGDGGEQQNNAETQCLHPDMSIYQSAKCNLTNLATIPDGCDANSNVEITISDNQIWYKKGNGPRYDYCNNCLYALNNQPDNGSLGQNQRVYISLNRVIDPSSPNVGRGLCKAKFRWICPNCEH